MQVAVDRSRAADLGVRMATIGNTLRLMVAGDDEITTYREAGEQYPVTVRVLESQRRDINMIGKLTVTSASGQPVRIDNIARLERGFGPTRISRSNRQYSINIGADTAPGHALDESSGDLRRIITEAKLPPGYTFQMRGQTQNLDETTDNLMLALLLASIFVYMVLAAQFESFVQPLVIMTVLPLSIPFALFTILATGRTLNLWSALGILLLFGIVKKNSILQVDYTNVLRARGVPRDEAIVDACRTRLRPISDDHTGDHLRAPPHCARRRHRRRPALGDRRHDHRRAVALPVPDAAAGARCLRQARCARAVVREPAPQRVVVEAARTWTGPPNRHGRSVELARLFPGTDVASGSPWSTDQ